MTFSGQDAPSLPSLRSSSGNARDRVLSGGRGDSVHGEGAAGSPEAEAELVRTVLGGGAWGPVTHGPEASAVSQGLTAQSLVCACPLF